MDKPTRRRIDGQILLSGLANFAMFVGGFCLAGHHMGWMAAMLLIYLAATGLQFYLMGKLATQQRHDD
ncbi:MULTISPECIES: hypothetical protein [Limosilactobacillus]|uniref:hypothetical protein n=1 Tax=Limosilactobacillus TaxID=2742598 RepID=UPI0024BA6B07|nr:MULTISPECIES: hypothetical protein [Limosilactobacillus]MDM8219342.1 hypothetical protein [Limosilactobacillus mucosae]MDM8314028.1 hypothetical protein [Limosilactobacillus mucosae]